MKMQSLSPKIFIIAALFLTLVFNIQANSLKNNNITTGDSLFEKKDYQAAIIYYKKAFEEDHAFSQQMLSRMAMIEESADHYVMTLYYLNTMYSYYPDSRVIQKMEDLGDKYHLSGYSYTDLEYLISIYKEYYYYIIFSLSAIGIPFIVYLFLRYKKGIGLGMRPFIFVCILGGVFYLNNYDITPSMGIIKSDCIIMEGPSSGSAVVENIDAGHRVRVIRQEGIWYEIDWKNQYRFVRDVYLLPIGN
jgi:tetratricopeptide (TPR) repeat protein